MRLFNDLPGGYPNESPPAEDNNTLTRSSAFPSYFPTYIGDLFNFDRNTDEKPPLRPSPEKARSFRNGSKSPYKPTKLGYTSITSKRKAAATSPTKLTGKRSAVIVSTVPAQIPSIPSKRQKPSSTSSGASASSITNPEETPTFSVMDIIRQHVASEYPTETQDAGPSIKLKKPVVTNSSGIVWKYRKNRRILDKPEKKKVASNAVQDLFDSDFMDTVEWETAGAQHARITEDPSLTSLDNIEVELQEQLYLIEIMPEKYDGIIVRYEDLNWIPENRGRDEDAEDDEDDEDDEDADDSDEYTCDRDVGLDKYEMYKSAEYYESWNEGNDDI